MLWPTDAQGLDLGTSEVDVTDPDLLKKRGHLQVAAGRVSVRRSMCVVGGVLLSIVA